MNHPVVRCKLICHSISPHPYTQGLQNMTFGAVWSPETGKEDDENAVFGKSTPYGHFTAAFSDQAAARMKVGQAYYVDFTPAE